MANITNMGVPGTGVLPPLRQHKYQLQFKNDDMTYVMDLISCERPAVEFRVVIDNAEDTEDDYENELYFDLFRTAEQHILCALELSILDGCTVVEHHSLINYLITGIHWIDFGSTQLQITFRRKET